MTEDDLKAVVVSPDDPLLAAIKAGLLHGLPELTGRQINEASLLAVIAVRRLENEQHAARR